MLVSLYVLIASLLIRKTAIKLQNEVTNGALQYLSC